MTGVTDNRSDYVFEIGDRVVTVFGEVGQIVDICKCERCKIRGFYEPIWRDEDEGTERHITLYDMKTGFDTFYQIGKYQFDRPFNKDYVSREIDFHEAQLKLFKKLRDRIEQLEKEKE